MTLKVSLDKTQHYIQIFMFYSLTDAAPHFNCLKEVACVADGFFGLSMGRRGIGASDMRNFHAPIPSPLRCSLARSKLCYW